MLVIGCLEACSTHVCVLLEKTWKQNKYRSGTGTETLLTLAGQTETGGTQRKLDESCSSLDCLTQHWPWLTRFCRSGTIWKLVSPRNSRPLPAETARPAVACDSIRARVGLMPRVTSCPVETSDVIHPGYSRISSYTHTQIYRYTHSSRLQPAVVDVQQEQERETFTLRT